jgi:hypothetical protein
MDNERLFEDYYFMKETAEFACKYSMQRTLLICNAGFENRSFTGLRNLSKMLDKECMCILLTIRNRFNPELSKTNALLESSRATMMAICAERGVQVHDLTCDLFDENKLVVGHEPIIDGISKVLNESAFEHIVFDVSSVPRVLIFPILKFLWRETRERDLFVIVTENEVERSPPNTGLEYTEPAIIPGFKGKDVGSDVIKIWIPVLGRDPKRIDRIEGKLHFDDIFPVVGFPSSTPVDTDLIVKLHKEFFNTHAVTLRDIIYTPFDNPFDVFLRMARLVRSLRVKDFENRMKITTSPFGTTAQSVGVCISAIILDLEVLSTQPVGYRPVASDEGKSYIHCLKGRVYSGKRRGT